MDHVDFYASSAQTAREPEAIPTRLTGDDDPVDLPTRSLRLKTPPRQQLFERLRIRI
jgi:hypothetical protein